MVFGFYAFKFYVLRAHDSAVRIQCLNQMKSIGIALRNYHVTYGTYPPAYVADENGKPMHSWRVLLLPYLDRNDIYKQYRFDEPWDGPNNRQLHDQIPEIFHCQSEKHENGNRFTNYVAVMGKSTPWSFANSVSSDDIMRSDGSSNTIHVVEMKNSGIHWMEPRDLNLTKMSLTINDPSQPCISCNHGHTHWLFQFFGKNKGYREPNILWADGSAKRLPVDISRERLKAFLTARGGETVQPLN